MPQPPFTAERFELPATPLRVDRDKCVIYGVRVLGPRSRNGHKYPDPYQRSLLTQLSGADCYWGHHYDPATMQPVEPPPDKKLGRHLNPRIEGSGVHTDLKYNPKCPHAEQLLWAAENDPEQLSLSQLARVRWSPARDADGDRVAEECLVLNSVDVVCKGGATSTVFESFTREAAVPTDPKALAAELETPGQIIDFMTAFVAGLKGLDQSTKDQIIQAITGGLTSGAAAPPENADATAAAPAMESIRRRYGKDPQVQWALGRLDGVFTAEALRKRREWAEGLIQSEGLSADRKSDLFVELVAESFGNEARAKAMIAERKQLGAAGGARTSPAGGGPKSVSDIVDGMVIG